MKMNYIKLLIIILTLITSAISKLLCYELFGWGNHGLIGNMGINGDSIPTQLNQDKDWKIVYSGVETPMLIKNNNSRWAWGMDDGDVGSGGDGSIFYITQIGDDCNWLKISSRHGSFALGIKNDSTLWGWGENHYGELGDSLNVQFNYPILLDSISKWKEIATCYHSSLAIKNDGTLWAWGQNNNGQLGLGNYLNSSIPTQIGNENIWEKIFGDFLCVIAIKSDGTMWGWGNNIDFKISPNFDDKNIIFPVQIGENNNWHEVTFSYGSALALKNDSTLWAWGVNEFGEMGNGSKDGYIYPTQIGMDRWIKVDAGFNHTIGIKSDGTLWGWGFNNSYQLGDGTTTNRFYPVIIDSTKNWVDISAGREFSLALRNGGTSVLRNIDVSISLFPNPVTSSFILSEIPEGAYTFEIYNIYGTKQIEGKIEKEINIEFLPSGIYFLKLNNERKPLKFVKM